ncbi:ADP-ribosylglycohydrolase family protein [Nocardia cyriacigeorgica]|uniref:ADP-ribosylglycohydrolase family protein n=1 Tax=Nocardia cyriacigeorgica TaxID=135487 RepID=UPI0013D3BCEC|nr:ADP-ribosylglycohydrolase family protein [Nocardia cyriacigeorgica]MBF6439164.1 ADP-ribosylglycohydrolase family protein [Nocardia cyriacigeorgica]NEW29468.1 ADP-ribosylglycohydrolase family protein [Nocardia cyriacigeorgica]
MTLDDAQLDRAAGALLGSAAGDALGAGYEFTYPSADQVIDMVGGGMFGWAPGQWTDDTSMAVAIALAADTSDKGIDLDEVAAGFMAWWDSQPPDVGVQTSKVLSARPSSARGMQAVAMSLPGLTGGNGSLMRTGPVALAYLGDPVECARAAGAIGLLTHHDQQAVEACKIWSHAIRHAILEANFDGVRDYVAACPAADYWNPLLDQAETGTPQDFPKNGWVVHALQTAWWAITTTDQSGPDHLPRALEQCVRAGNDTDTTAAIAGALLGARWGASAVPARWRELLHGYPGLTGNDLVALAHRIVVKNAG